MSDTFKKSKKRSTNFLRLMLFGLIIKILFRPQDQIHVENAVVLPTVKYRITIFCNNFFLLCWKCLNHFFLRFLNFIWFCHRSISLMRASRGSHLIEERFFTFCFQRYYKSDVEFRTKFHNLSFFAADK